VAIAPLLFRQRVSPLPVASSLAAVRQLRDVANRICGAQIPLAKILVRRSIENIIFDHLEQIANRACVGYAAFEDLFDQAEQFGVAAYAIDADGFLQRYNSQAEEVWGWSPPLSLQRWGGARDFYYPDGRLRPADTAPLSMAARQRRIVQEDTVLFRKPDNSRVAGRGVALPILSSGIGIVGGFNFFLDVTERMFLENKYISKNF